MVGWHQLILVSDDHHCNIAVVPNGAEKCPLALHHARVVFKLDRQHGFFVVLFGLKIFRTSKTIYNMYHRRMMTTISHQQDIATLHILVAMMMSRIALGVDTDASYNLIISSASTSTRTKPLPESIVYYAKFNK